MTHIQMQTVDGQFFASDEFDLASSGLLVQEYEEQLANIESIFQNWRDADFVGMEIGGRTRYFNPVNVLWAEVVR